MKSRLPKGVGKGPGDMNSMIRQAQKMQDKMADVQAELDEREFTAAVGGGVVEIVMNGKKEVKTITLKPEVVDPEDIEMLQDLLTAAVNQVIQDVETTSSEELGKVTGGLNVPGLF